PCRGPRALRADERRRRPAGDRSDRPVTPRGILRAAWRGPQRARAAGGAYRAHLKRCAVVSPRVGCRASSAPLQAGARSSPPPSAAPSSALGWVCRASSAPLQAGARSSPPPSAAPSSALELEQEGAQRRDHLVGGLLR